MEIKPDSVLYFWNSSCSVCGPLYKKLEVLVQGEFPKLHLQKINLAEQPEFRARYGVFTAPLIILLLDGKENWRSGGNVGLHEIRSKIERLYHLKYDK